MSAEVLRKAARRMREQHGPEHERHEMWAAMADWLDEVAERQKPTQHWGRRSHGWTGSAHANAVARAYLDAATSGEGEHG